MGQQESKQKLNQVTQSLERIRKDVRNGKITANDVERIQEILNKFTVDVEGHQNVRVSSGYTIGQLIDITSKELDALKQEVNLDQAAVPTNSFSRGSSKNYSKEKRKSIKSITDSVTDIRNQLRSGKIPQEDYDRLQRDLANYSGQLSGKRSKKTEVDAAQKLISSVSQELFTKQLQNAETASLKRSSLKRGDRASTSEKRVSLREEPRKEPPQITSRISTNNLEDIEQKFNTLKKDIKVAETNKDKSRLHFLSKSIQTLMTDLQMVNVGSHIVSEEKKELLEKNLQRSYHQIDKIKRQLTEQNDLQYLADLHKKEQKEKSLEDLDDLQNQISEVARNLNAQNFQKEKETFNQCKIKLNAIEETDQEISAKKAEVSDTMSKVENMFTRLEMEERLNQAEYRHFQYKIDLTKFAQTSDSEAYKKHRQYLVQLKEYVGKVLEINQKIDEKKKYVLFNIDNNIVALDQKVKENEQTQKAIDEVVLRKAPPSRNDSLKGIVSTVNGISTSLPPNELGEILSLLNEARTAINTKLSLLQSQNDAQLVTVKEKRLQPIVKSVNQSQPGQIPTIIDTKLGLLQSQNDAQLVTLEEKRLPPTVNSLPPVQSQLDGIPTTVDTKVGHLQNQNGAQLITVQEKRWQRPVNSVPPVQIQLNHIQKEVEALQTQIENSRYSKDTQYYKDIKNKLDSYRNQVIQVKESENLVKYIDNVSLLLENNLAGRKSTTEDMLVDIMSVGSRVGDLGQKIQNFSHTIHDYDSIKNSLLENRNYLRSLQITSNRTNLYKSRNDILDQIERYLTNLEDMKKNENGVGGEEEKRFNQDLRKVKEKVYRYSGTYKNVLYKTIENDLDKYLNEADKVFKDGNIASRVKQDIANTKMILEQRSTKDQQYNIRRGNSDAGSKQLTEIKQNVDNVKNGLSQIEPLSKEDLDKLDARLTLSILALDNIRDDHHNDNKDKLYQDIHQQFQKIHELQLVAKSTNRVEIAHQKPPDEKHTMAMTIAKIEQELEEIKPEILTFVGTETSPNFLLLDEILVRGTLKLDEMDADHNIELSQRKARLMREIHKFSDILDDRINQTEEIEKMENEVKVMLIKIDSFNGYFGDSEYTRLDEEIIKLKVSLGKLQVNQQLVARKDACIKEVDDCMKRLNEAARSRSSLLGGTLV